MHLTTTADTATTAAPLPRDAPDLGECPPERLADGRCASEAEGLLRLTLSIITAPDETTLEQRTLAAAMELTGAVSGTIATPGTAGETLAGYPSAQTLAGPLGQRSVVVCVTAARRREPRARQLFDLVLAHANTSLDRLAELDRLTRQAASDPLTGLRHQRSFTHRLVNSVPGRTAILAIDVDNFKSINDRYGHLAGDEALVCLTGELRCALRGDDSLYRIGGDEFAVIVDVNSDDEAVAIANRLLDAARASGHPVSIGVTVRRDGETGQDAVRRADEALYQAKRDGRDTIRLAA